jgi:hypothetical protein
MMTHPEKIPGLTDGDLAALRDNAERLIRRGTAQQRQSATALLPSIEAELTSRRKAAASAGKGARKGTKPAGFAVPAPLAPRSPASGRTVRGGMTGHAFRVGQLVQFPVRQEIGRDAARMDYRIERLLPADAAGDAQYRIRSVLDGTERVVREPEVIARPVSPASAGTGRTR